jgi:hypothetical protein
LAEGAGEPTLADAGGPGEQQALPLSDEVAPGQLEEEATVEAAHGAEVGILDLRVVTQSGGASPGFEALLSTLRRFALEEKRQPLPMLQGPGLRLGFQILKAFGHSGQTKLVQKVEGRMGQHDRVSPQWK